MDIALAYLSLNRWLEGFAYRVEVGPGIFLLVAVLDIIIVLASVRYQSILGGNDGAESEALRSPV